MSVGCFGNSFEDRYFSRQLDRHLAAQDAHAEMIDALFGGVKVRKPTLEDNLGEAIALANRLDLLLLEIAKQDPHSANIEESQEFAQGILLNVAGYRREINAPCVPCDCGGNCDSCVAARSDEHYDRKRDGMAA